MAAAGSRFETYVRDAMGEAEVSLAELARRSGVAETNWHSWFRGEHRPRANSLVLASGVLNRTPQQLLARWDGERVPRTRPQETDAEALIREMRRLVAAIEEQTAALGRAYPARPRSAPPVAEAEALQDELTRASSSPAPRRIPRQAKGQ